jgi:uncharacterized repeat protein (TIGR01451 family)
MMDWNRPGRHEKNAAGPKSGRSEGGPLKVRTMQYSKTMLLLLLPLLAAGLLAGQAQAQGQIQLRNAIEMEVESVNAAGQKETYRIPVDTAEPGAHLIYSIHYKNAGPEQAVNAVITTALPANIQYQEGSARGADTSITFSIDGGRTYHLPAQLLIKDASGRQFPAQPGDYSHIRWRFETPLPPGAAGTVSYRAILK